MLLTDDAHSRFARHHVVDVFDVARAEANAAPRVGLADRGRVVRAMDTEVVIEPDPILAERIRRIIGVDHAVGAVVGRIGCFVLNGELPFGR